MGYNRRSGTGYLSSPGGHASISDDGSGNVVIAGDVIVATGKKVKTQGGSSVSAPFLTVDGAATHGIHVAAGNVTVSVNGSDKIVVTPSVIQAKDKLLVSDILTYGPTADQSITGTGSTISVNSAMLKITSDGVYTLTNALAAGADGQPVRIENVGSNQVTLQEGAVIAAAAFVDMSYSTDAGIWLEAP